MSVIPTISVTEEHFSDDVEEATESTGLNINEVHTDVENLDSDGEEKVKKRRSVCLGVKKVKCDALTDVEDMNDSGSEGEEEKTPAKEICISLEEFLDQGYVEEATKFSGHKQHMSDAPPKTSNTLTLEVDDKAAVTDCENLNASDDEEESDRSYEEDSKAIVLEGGNTVEAHDSLKGEYGRFPQSPIHLTTTGESTSSSESETDTRHLKLSHKKGCKSKKNHPPVSDTENIMFSDEEVQKRRCLIKKLPLILDGWEEVTIQLSDGEDESAKTPMYPEIAITFAEDAKKTKKAGEKKKPSLLKVDEVDDGLTDVENLNSSDDDEDDQAKRQLIPSAIIKSKVGFITDTEDIDEVESEDEETPEIALPAPTRELVEVREDRVRQQIIRPKYGESLGLGAGYIDKGMTDVEDVSDVEDLDQYDESHSIEKTPDLDMGNVHVSEKVITSSKLAVNSQITDPVTDTEELGQAGQFGQPGPTLRRRKNKNRCSARKQKHLAVKSQNLGGTDIEELDMSDTEGSKQTKEVRKKKGRTSIAVPVIVSNDGAKTDVEYVSADDFPPEYDGLIPNVDTNSFMGGDTFVSSVTDSVGGSGERKTAHHVPVIRKVSLVADGVHLPYTDTEDLAVPSDQEDLTYSRAQTATPFEVHQALDDASSTIHDRSINAFDVQTEKLNIKGHRECQEVYTDVEYVDDESRRE